MRKLSKNFVNQIHHCDAIVGMKRLPDHCIHLTVTSPPYDGLRTFGGVGWNDNTFRPMADELWRITIPGGVVVWIVADTIVNGSETCTRRSPQALLPGDRVQASPHDGHGSNGGTLPQQSTVWHLT